MQLLPEFGPVVLEHLYFVLEFVSYIIPSLQVERLVPSVFLGHTLVATLRCEPSSPGLPLVGPRAPEVPPSFTSAQFYPRVLTYYFYIKYCFFGIFTRDKGLRKTTSFHPLPISSLESSTSNSPPLLQDLVVFLPCSFSLLLSSLFWLLLLYGITPGTPTLLIS